MADQKLENILNLALDSTESEREQSIALNTGYQGNDRWELIIGYTGNLTELLQNYPDITVTELLGGYAILTVPRMYIESLSSLPQISFIEQPKRLFFAINQAKSASCINLLYQQPWNLTGKGILIGIVDSGITLSHPDFLTPQGNTRVLFLWDQTVAGSPPSGYSIGTEWNETQINESLQRNQMLSQDMSGHGTAVTGIAAGNGRASDGRFRGVAYEASLIIVKLGTPMPNSFPRTTELMQGVNYCIQKAVELQMPLVLNLSFGNNYGSHDGTALLETYLNQVSSVGKTTICIGSGNEGASAIHTSGTLSEYSEHIVELSVGSYEPTLNLQVWKIYADDFDIAIETPSGVTAGPFQQLLGTQRFRIGQTNLLLYYGKPAPYSQAQEIFIEFLPAADYVDSGIWKIHLLSKRLVTGRYDMWLPGGGILNTNTRFLLPSPETTLTIPSTAASPITVGAYNSLLDSYADFSGRGFTRQTNQIKPDLVAPGVSLTAPASPDGYLSFTGTSFATPVVSGSAALMMEWGIIQGNDPFLYGEKLKAYLIKGAKRLPGYQTFPNPQVGWGALCVRDSFPL